MRRQLSLVMKIELRQKTGGSAQAERRGQTLFAFGVMGRSSDYIQLGLLVLDTRSNSSGVLRQSAQGISLHFVGLRQRASTAFSFIFSSRIDFVVHGWSAMAACVSSHSHVVTQLYTTRNDNPSHYQLHAISSAVIVLVLYLTEPVV